MIGKNHKHRGPNVKVTFTVPADWLDRPVCVVGDFNDWDPTATPLRKKGSARVASVVMEPGRTYSFRYLDSEGRWYDDPAADGVVLNGFGGTNSVIDLRG